MSEQTCPECHGTGLVWSEGLQEDDCCKRCDGNGVVEQPFGEEKLTREQLNYENKN